MRNFTIIALFAVVASAPVQADTLDNVATALDFAGFDARGSQNPLSGGVDLLVTRQFNGNVFDFGNAEFILQGPISLQLATGGRILPGFDVSLTTALNSRSQVGTLSYNYSSDIGPQSTAASGSMIIDADFSMNALGFYDLTLTSSSRNTVIREGIVNETTTNDSDLGPIEISGNIFVDAIGILVDPLYEQAGRENPFQSLSKLIDSGMNEHALLWNSSEVSNDIFGAFVSQRVRSLDGQVGRGLSVGAAVPEPTVLAMLLLGVPLVTRRASRFCRDRRAVED